MTDFNLERLLNDQASGAINGFDFFIDPAHNDRPDHVDLHVLMEKGGQKYAGLGGVEQLREQLPWLQDGQHLNQNNF